MTRVREVHYYDHGADFGLSGLAGTLCARAALRLDEAVVLALAGAAAEDDDLQLGRDVRLLLDSPLPDGTLRVVWLAAVRRCFDPVEESTDTRAWLRRVSEVCPSRTPDRDPYEVKALDEVRPTVSEEELRTTVGAEIQAVADGLERAVAVPDIVPALLRVVHEVDADLGFRMFLRAVKAYSVPVEKERYDRLVAIGDLLAHPAAAVYDRLHVRWPPVDPGRRDFRGGAFGVPHLASVLSGTDWQYQGTARQNTEGAVRADLGDGPGSKAAVLLDDARRLLDSALSDEAVTALWRAASRRLYVVGEDEFDADGRAWLEQVAHMCREHLTEVDPVYAPSPSPARSELAEPVLREVREAVRTDVVEVRGVARVLEEVVTTVDPDLGFRFLLQLLFTHGVPVTESQRGRYEALAGQLGYSADHVDDRLPRQPH